VSIFPKVTIGKLLDDGVLLAVQDGNHGEIHPTTADYVDVGIPFVMASDLNGNQLDLVGCKFITEARASGLRKGFAKTGDVLLTHKGSLGLTDVVGPIGGPFVMLTPQVTYYRPDGDRIESHFLKYVFQSPFFQGQMFAHSRDGTRPYIGITAQRELEVLLPDFDVQCRVATVLRAYDDLIATNQRRIALLEDAARRLYREWFLHLRFPGHESVLVKDGVPEGWCKKPIAAHTSFLNRGITPKYDDTAKGWVINQKCIRDGRISMEPARHQSKDVKPDRLIRTGDVLINSTGAGTLGRVAQVRAPNENCTVDTHITIARPRDKESSTYFGQALLELAPLFSEMGKGATNQLELSRSDIGEVKIWQPPKHLHVEFHRLVGPMLVQAEQLSVTNMSLEKARDLLLPKLMSGQLDVSGITLLDEVAA
jgi:type I restriction enzyme S subunit